MRVLRKLTWIALAGVAPLAAALLAYGEPAGAAAVLLAPLYVKAVISVADVCWLCLTGRPLIAARRAEKQVAPSEAEAAFRRDLEVTLKFRGIGAGPSLFRMMRKAYIRQAALDRWLLYTLRYPAAIANRNGQPEEQSPSGRPAEAEKASAA